MAIKIMEITAQTAEKLRITTEEFKLIIQKLGVHQTLQNSAPLAACGVNTAVTKTL